MTTQPSYAKLETVADIALIMGLVGYHPDDSRSRASTAIEWAEEFEVRYSIGFTTGELDEDCYINFVDAFALSKLEEVNGECTNWNNADARCFAVWPLSNITGESYE